MAKTRAELINEALTLLGALPAGQEPSAEDYWHVDGKVEPVLEDLAERGVSAASDTDISDAAFLHLAAVLAYHCRGYFGVVGEEAAGLAQARLMAERDLRFMNRSSPGSQPVRATYF